MFFKIQYVKVPRYVLNPNTPCNDIQLDIIAFSKGSKNLYRKVSCIIIKEEYVKRCVEKYVRGIF